MHRADIVLIYFMVILDIDLDLMCPDTFIKYVPCFWCGQWNVANDNQRVIYSRTQFGPVDCDKIAILTPKKLCCTGGMNFWPFIESE